VRQGAKGAQRGSDSLPRLLRLVRSVGHHYRERRRQRVCDVVRPEQREVVALEQRRSQNDELIARRVEIARGLTRQRERIFVAGDVAHHPLHGFVVIVDDPGGIPIRVDEEARLVGVVLFDRRVPVEVVGTQIRKHSDIRL